MPHSHQSLNMFKSFFDQITMAQEQKCLKAV